MKLLLLLMLTLVVCDNIKIGLMDSAFDEWHEDLRFTQTWNNFTTLADLVSSGENHGTHVAGTMGALFNNGDGITGISVKNRLYGYSFNGNTDLNLANASTIFEYKYALVSLIGNNVKVINLSWGYRAIGFGASQDVSSAKLFMIENANIIEPFLEKLIDKGYEFLLVMSAGNGNNVNYYENPGSTAGYVSVVDYNANPTAYPDADTTTTYGAPNSSATNILNEVDAQYNHFLSYVKKYKISSRILCVGSVDSSYSLSAFSNVGSRVDILAPGESIYSSGITGTHSGGNYYSTGGTSMSAPHVSGTLGLAFSINPAIEASRLKNIVKANARNIRLETRFLDAADTIEWTMYVLDILTETGENTSNNQYNGIAIGRVIDENGDPLSDVKVTAMLEDANGISGNNDIANVVMTDDEGYYEIIIPAGTYRLEFEKMLYLGETMYYQAIQERTVYLDTITLYDESWTDSIFLNMYGQVYDAITGSNVSGAQVKLRNGWNNKTGSYVTGLFGIVKQETTDSSGSYSVSLQVGAYTAEISKNGYVTAYINVTSSPNNGIQYATITPVLDDNEYRIILTWGDTPRDLDSHLTGTVNGNSFHVYYGSKSYSYNGTTIASLDWDDTSSYGPETVTLTWTGDIGNCTYYVQDFTNGSNSNSTALSYSSAKVMVYQGNSLIETYNVPIGFRGTRWNVFSISNGTITTINTIT
jgi:hypothetical protein